MKSHETGRLRLPRTALGWLTALAVLGSAVFALLTLTSPAAAAATSTPIAVAVSFLGVTAALRNALDRRCSARTRQAWALLAVGAATIGLGDILWPLFPADQPGGVKVSDFVYLGYHPFVLAGLLRFPGLPFERGERLRLGLDLATVFTGAAMLFAGQILPGALALGGDALEQVLRGAPAVGDLVLVTGCAILLMRQRPRAVRRVIRVLVPGFAAYVAADLWYALGGAETYVDGAPADAVWLVGALVVPLAALRQTADASADVTEGAPTEATWAGILVPFGGIALGFALVIHAAALAPGPTASNVAVVAGAAVLCALVIARQSLAMIDRARLTGELQQQYGLLADEQERSERLLRNVLPDPIADRLKQRPGEVIADSFAEATVLFADLVGFTTLSARTPPDALVEMLDDVFSRFDELSERHGLEKIKTIGDAYMAAAGVPTPRPDHAEAAAAMALDMNDALADVNRRRGLALSLRIGLHSGPVVAGVIGSRKFIYDLWGDTVNVASRMESHGVPGRVHVSPETRARLEERFVLTERGTIDVKGRGPMTTWLLEGRR